jgi:hypothetical protein
MDSVNARSVCNWRNLTRLVIQLQYIHLQNAGHKWDIYIVRSSDSFRLFLWFSLLNWSAGRKKIFTCGSFREWPSVRVACFLKLRRYTHGMNSLSLWSESVLPVLRIKRASWLVVCRSTEVSNFISVFARRFQTHTHTHTHRCILLH